jgi:hypothetical protein
MKKQRAALALAAMMDWAPLAAHAEYTTVEKQLPIPLQTMYFATGTWTLTNTSGMIYMLKTATDETSTIITPIHLPRRTASHGVKLKSIKIPVRVTTADLDAAPSSVLYRNDFDLVVAGASGDAAAATITETEDGSLTADAQDRLYTITVTSPDWDYDTEATCDYTLVTTVNAAATSVVRVYAPIAVYDELE